MTDAAFPVGATPAGALPAPVWFLLGLKGVGTFLHFAAMHLVLAGLPVALFLAWTGRRPGPARDAAARLTAALPVAFALTVNFGLVPLLALQVGWAPVFFPATIVMAWSWFAVIPLVLAAYAGAYGFAAALKGGGRPRPLGWTAGAVAAGGVAAVSLLFAGGLGLVGHPAGIVALFDRTADAAAVPGLAFPSGETGFLPRWLLTVGLAPTTLSVFLVADAAWAAPEALRGWQRRVALRLHSAGLAVFLAAGAWYARTGHPAALLDEVGRDFAATAVAGLAAGGPLVAWAAAVAAAAWGTRGPAAAAVVAQGAALAGNVAARQWVQMAALKPAYDPAVLPTSGQWGPAWLFAVAAVASLFTVGWIARQYAFHAGRPERLTAFPRDD